VETPDELSDDEASDKSPAEVAIDRFFEIPRPPAAPPAPRLPEESPGESSLEVDHATADDDLAPGF
jgi:hypothetical protein